MLSKQWQFPKGHPQFLTYFSARIANVQRATTTTSHASTQNKVVGNKEKFHCACSALSPRVLYTCIRLYVQLYTQPLHFKDREFIRTGDEMITEKKEKRDSVCYTKKKKKKRQRERRKKVTGRSKRVHCSVSSQM